MSRKCLPLSGVSCTVVSLMVWPTVAVSDVTDEAMLDTSTTSLLEATRRAKFCAATWPTVRITLLATTLCMPEAVTLTR